MDRHTDLEKHLRELMSADASEMTTPPLSRLHAAREAVFAHKKIVKEEAGFFRRLVIFLRLDFKFYHVGLSLLLISAGIFYVNEPNYNPGSAADFIDYHEALSIKNTTISVNSSTMLTSIPTTIIRN